MVGKHLAHIQGSPHSILDWRQEREDLGSSAGIRGERPLLVNNQLWTQIFLDRDINTRTTIYISLGRRPLLGHILDRDTRLENDSIYAFCQALEFGDKMDNALYFIVYTQSDQKLCGSRLNRVLCQVLHLLYVKKIDGNCEKNTAHIGTLESSIVIWES
ncbi:unnamed protein product [Ilex paraguariensis]|uniref:Uncharacterized protein n=1 Tax=Ilex paraguariensis TaxID=185542 RepID=A0ABC8UJG8_9AQUA